MKKQKNVSSMIVSLGLFMMFALVSVATAVAAVKLPNVQIPATGSVNSAPFTVSDTGTIAVPVRIKTSGILGFNGESRFKATLRKVGSTTDLDSKEINVRDTYEQVTLRFAVSDCTGIGSYLVRLSNSAPLNRVSGEAEFPEFTPPIITPTTGTLARFGVTQGNTIPIAIPSRLEPAGNSGGRLKITATWDGFCGIGSNCRLRFQLKRNERDFGDAVTGISHSVLFGDSFPKMTINLNVPADQVSGDWSLEIKGDSRGDVSNVISTVSFTPRCGN